ncbi:hypothetical protein [Mesonia aquimarina]|uniref:hypothetical protein n=1 Tax=Mesonia aquimarina TaxID=1504967 RepID=UPI000EF61BAC|nr:hypothetical protein [Mesonia aquimarina]
MKNSTLILFSFIVLISFSSCNDEKSELLFENSGWFYSYEVYKKPKNNDSVSYSYSSNIGGFQTKGSSIKTMVSLSTFDSYKHSKVELKNVEDSIKHDVYFKGSWNSTAKKQFLSDVLNNYNLKLNKKEVQEDFYEIYVADEEKLNEFASKNKGIHSIESDRFKLKHTNVTLKQAISQIYENVVYKGNHQQKYDLTFYYRDFDSNKEFFKKYGLAYRKIQEPVLHYIVEKS